MIGTPINGTHQIFQEVGVQMNIFETESMIYIWDLSSDGLHSESIMKFRNTKLLNSKFEYFGVWICYSKFSISGKENEHFRCTKITFLQHCRIL